VEQEKKNKEKSGSAGGDTHNHADNAGTILI